MHTTSYNDILFDDLAAIRLLNHNNQSADATVQYNDCTNNYNDCTNNYNDCTNNVYAAKTAEQLSPDCNCSGYHEVSNPNGDCGN
ncbi:hypothetical protein ACFQ3S_17285 [Mucilaginibacter terrae]|uniref:hypothetical protein n=1 Tax=Mucilaginibacter terrae TaxID=1955052 RepID=UPI0036288181